MIKPITNGLVVALDASKNVSIKATLLLRIDTRMTLSATKNSVTSVSFSFTTNYLNSQFYYIAVA
jgi:hypothetical protein